MSYAVPVEPARPRPAVVTAAVYLIWAFAALRVIVVALNFVPTPELDQALAEFNGDDATAAAAQTFEQVANVIVGLVVVLVAGVLAIFVGRGSQPARITTWVIAGIGTLCLSCGLAGSFAVPALLDGMANTADPEAEQAIGDAQRLLDLTPSWLLIAINVAGVLSVLALVVAIILLAVPAANEYFRKQHEIWVPPTTGAGGGFPQNPPSQPPYPPTQS